MDVNAAKRERGKAVEGGDMQKISCKFWTCVISLRIETVLQVNLCGNVTQWQICLYK